MLSVRQAKDADWSNGQNLTNQLLCVTVTGVLTVIRHTHVQATGKCFIAESNTRKKHTIEIISLKKKFWIRR
jgi:hypothetical protein